MLSWNVGFLLAFLLLVLLYIAVYLALIIFTPTTLPRSSAETFFLSAGNPQTPLPLTSLDEPATLSLSVIVPAYNERDRIEIMVDEAMTYILESIYGGDIHDTKSHHDLESRDDWKGEGTKKEWFEDGVEVVVVDDGSKDDTARVTIDLAGRWHKVIQDRQAIEKKKEGGQGKKWPRVDIRIIKLEKNRGKGGAVRHGVLFARGKRILFADADGASRFSDLTALQTRMDTILSPATSPVKHNRRKSLDGMFGRQAEDKALKGHGLVAGSRAHLEKSDAVVKRSFVRNLLMHGFHLFVRTMGVSGIRDTQCGFKLFTRETARVLFPQMHLHRWSFDVELLLLASIIGIPVAEVPIDWHEVSGSKINVGWDGIGMARDLLVLRGNLIMKRWKVPRIERVVDETED